MEAFQFTLHLRKPQATCGEYRALLKALPESMHHRIMLHEAYELAEEFPLKGLHFSARKQVLARHFPEVFKSTSAHSLEELSALQCEYNYIFLGPVFPSISKSGYSGTLEHDRVGEFLKTASGGRVMAIGGIALDTLEAVRTLGFHGVAVLGSVWGNQPGEANRVFENFKKIYQCIHAVPTV